MKTIVDNVAIEYADEGSGPVLLMLHGWADNLHTFDSLVKELSGFRIVRLDLPGFGGSERPRQTWGVGEYAAFVQAFCKKIDIVPEALIGHSFGGRVIIKGVGDGVLTPHKIVLIASAGIAKKRTLKGAMLRVFAKIGKAATKLWPLSIWRQKLRRRLYLKIGSDYFAAGSMKDVFLKVVSEDLLPFAAHIQIPALLIWGAMDHSTPLAQGKRLHEAIKGSELKVIDGASHFVHQEHPKGVAQWIEAFV